jgi:hypothetical protein
LLLFRTDFYLAHRPTYLLSPAQRAEPEHRRLVRGQRPAALHSGHGYVYAAYRAGLSCLRLPDTTPPELRIPTGGLIDDLVFHLGGVVRVRQHGLPAAFAPAQRVRLVRRERLLGVARAVLPGPVRRTLRRRFGSLLRSGIDAPRRSLDRGYVEAVYEQLMADPQAFLRRLCREPEPDPER